ncbi:hypothetical protein Ctob_015964 [Chrysochromulina tobinii]|uniref:Uncharacterized protein n=1 Tax=Chrysochromulina tobinii TaxID=1460289 RepID=A0A0M0K3X9_9EUKA|nr:hypothetical protein Ctob_015964 [Chrysochromulina tobinii]|eukprot:KOO33317.1 hypothetical protein Ctob_015964 [Chrysochromulina sp. CCMP291]
MIVRAPTTEPRHRVRHSLPRRHVLPRVRAARARTGHRSSASA